MGSPNMTRRAWRTSGTPVALATNGIVRDARGLASIVEPAVRERELDVDEPDDAERRRDRGRLRLKLPR